MHKKQHLKVDGNTESIKQAAIDRFMQQIVKRPYDAFENYFLSHGIYLKVVDLSKIKEMPEHAHILEKLDPLLRTIANAITLVHQIGWVSISIKRETLKSVKKLEETLAEAVVPHQTLSPFCVDYQRRRASSYKPIISWLYPIGIAAIIAGIVLFILGFYFSGAISLIFAIVSIFFYRKQRHEICFDEMRLKDFERQLNYRSELSN